MSCVLSASHNDICADMGGLLQKEPRCLIDIWQLIRKMDQCCQLLKNGGELENDMKEEICFSVLPMTASELDFNDYFAVEGKLTDNLISVFINYL